MAPVVTTSSLCRIRIAAETAHTRAMESLALELASYFAGAVHEPLGNARSAVSSMLERAATLPLENFLDEFELPKDDFDQAMAMALNRIGRSIGLIRNRALDDTPG